MVHAVVCSDYKVTTYYKSHCKLAVTLYAVVLHDIAPRLSRMVLQEVLVINICSHNVLRAKRKMGHKNYKITSSIIGLNVFKMCHMYIYAYIFMFFFPNE